MTPIPGPHEGLNAAVAAQIQAERAAKGLTVKQLAEASDVHYGSLRRYLKCERDIDVATAEALASALGLEVIDLVADAMKRMERQGGAARLNVAGESETGLGDESGE